MMKVRLDKAIQKGSVPRHSNRYYEWTKRVARTEGCLGCFCGQAIAACVTSHSSCIIDFAEQR